MINMELNFFRKRKRGKLIRKVIANTVETGFGPPPEFFTPSEFINLQKAVKMADEYSELFATVEYPEVLQPARKEYEDAESEIFIE